MKTLITALCLMLSFGYAYTQVILYTPCETNIVPIAEDSSDVFTEKEGLWLNKTLNPLYEQQVLKGGFLRFPLYISGFPAAKITTVFWE